MSSSSERNHPKNNADKLRLGEYQTIEELFKNGLAQIIDATKCTNAFPQGATRDLYCAYPSFGRIIDEQSNRILGLISKVLKYQNIRGNIQLRQQDEQFEMLLECNDTIFERIQSNLDELAGVKKHSQIIVESQSKASATKATEAKAGSWNLTKRNANSSLNTQLINPKNIEKPQTKFRTPVDNSSKQGFIPNLKYKPNAIKPLAIMPEFDEENNITSCLHPYEFELMKFDASLNALSPKVVEKYKELGETCLDFIDTVDKLHEAMEELRQASELAVDLEHHSHRSFLGFTCLLQISTKSKDYILDALALREELQILNEIFTDPKVTKIFHGADNDVEWLQRDFSLYIVNMFDTHQAARALNFARFSLAYLLKHYCNIEVDKSFQLADWRIRPLPNELLTYARQDTHYLIYIYENLVNDLLKAGKHEANLLMGVLQRSTELCKKIYVKPVITADSHLDMYRKSKKLFDNQQLWALREIFLWRDAVARDEDESYNFVLPDHMLLQIAENLPREMQGILASCNPIPPLVKKHLHALHQIILKARQQALVKPTWLESEPIHRGTYLSLRDYNSKLYCPHDLKHCEEFRDDLPTLLKFENGKLLKNDEYLPQSSQTDISKPILSVFDRLPSIQQEHSYKVKQKDKLLLSYRRYLAVLPSIEREIRNEAARLEEENNRMQLCPTTDKISLVEKETNPTKIEKKTQKNTKKSESIREFLKRKCQEAFSKKSSSEDTERKAECNDLSNSVKRIKTESAQQISTPNDDKLSFTNLPKQNKQRKLHKVESSSTIFTLKSNNNNNQTSVLENDPANSEKDQPATSRREISKRKKLKSCSKSFQSSDRPVVVPNFNYGNVDFKQFKGGAQKIICTDIKQQHYKKNNSGHAHNKKFNKLFTFSKVKCIKK